MLLKKKDNECNDLKRYKIGVLSDFKFLKLFYTYFAPISANFSIFK